MLNPQAIPLSGAPCCWFVVGGWALDLYLGKQTRPHSDVDLGIFRKDQLALQQFLRDWSLSKVVENEEREWKRGEWLTLPVHEVHAKNSRGMQLEFLFSESDDSNWIYRRDSEVTMPLTSATVTARDGIRVLAPEIVLLFKSKDRREHDQLDFDTVRPHLRKEQAQWLLEAIEATDTSHAWAARLARQA